MISVENEKKYKEKMQHTTAELPIALHHMEYPGNREMLFYLHWHQEFEFFVVLTGSIELTVENHVYNMEPGDCVFINSNAYHSAKNIGRCDCSFFALDFSWEFLQENMYSHFSRQYIRPVLEYHLLFPEFLHASSDGFERWQIQVIQYLQDIFALGQTHLVEHELTVKARIYQIWELLYLHAVPTKDAIDSKKLEQRNRLIPILNYIHENYADDISLSELAALIPMSEGQFCRIFKETMKVSPFQYLMRYRIMQSCSILLETDKKIGEIANLTGFNNISYYNRVFLEMIGCTPRQYRISYDSSPVLMESKSLDT